MSLHTLANHLQTAGRGGDSLLVHMTPHEVSGLQSLAMSHGGSLTINPQTGLPEAGFLSGILPMVAGAALAATGVGAPMAALMVGGAGAAATGSLGKGLMMGLGAYGGAGLGASLLGGAEAAAGAAGAAGVPAMVSGGAMPGVVGGAGALAPAAGGAAAAAPAAGNFAGLSGTNVNAMTGLPAAPPTTQLPINAQNVGNPFMPANPSGSVVSTAPQTMNAPAPSVESATSGFMDKLKSMPTKAFDLLSGSGPEADKQREEFLKQNKNYLIASGIGVLGASREDPRKPKEEKYDIHDYDWNTRRFSPSSRAPGSTAERTYFAAGGGLMGLPVEQMSQQNATSDNTRYPMAFQKTPTYAMPSQRPISQNVVYPATDDNTNIYTGEEKSMASGGVVALATGGVSKEDIQKQIDAIKAKPASTAMGAKFYSKEQNEQIKNLEAQLKTASQTTTDNKSTTATSNLTGLGSIAAGATSNTANTTNTTGGIASIAAGATSNAASNFTLSKQDIQKQIDAIKPNGRGVYSDDQQKQIKNLQNQLNATTQTTTGGLGSIATKATSNTANTTTNTADSTTRSTDTIGSRDVKTNTTGGSKKSIQDQIDAIRANPGQTNPMGGGKVLTAAQNEQISALQKQLKTAGNEEVLQPDGSWGPAKVTPEYEKIEYGSISALKGWDSRKKYIEPEDVTRIFEEVVGRKPTNDEINRYQGKNTSLQDIANQVNKNTPDIKTARGKNNPFTDEELQNQAKYYWGREMTKGELTAYKSKNLANFGALRDALTTENAYVDHLNEINQAAVEKQNVVTAAPATKEDIASVYTDILGRKPKRSEVQAYIDKKITKKDLENQLKISPEYESRYYQTEYDQYGHEITYDASGKPIAKDANGKVIIDGSGGNTSNTGITTVLPEGGGTGLVPPITYYTPGTMTQAEMEEYGKKYASYDPTQQPNVNLTGTGSNVYTAGSPYKPLTGPQFSIAGSLPYQDINKNLGTAGLYEQMSKKMPELQQGLKFDPKNVNVMGSAFSNVAPGIVTLQSTATPQAYNPTTSFDPTQQAYSSGLSPEEQKYLSMMQLKSKKLASGGMASYNLGGYSDGGRLLKGPGDGVSDSIPATIGDRQPARLADGEFVVPARIVSELGNGSTDAGARKLYAMMERIQRARSKTVGRGKVAVKSGADNMLPA